MPISLNRRHFLHLAGALPLLPVYGAWAGGKSDTPATLAALMRIEQELGGRLGVFVLDTGSGAQLSYRGDERFPLCSTFKVVLAAAILQRSMQDSTLLQRRIRYQKSDLISHSPICAQHLDSGMTVDALCAATIQYSDNAAANLLMKILGGPPAVTAFARSIGDRTFRLERWETELNSAIPGDPRDTTTPAAMVRTLQRTVLGEALNAAQRQRLQTWLLGNTTGGARIRAGVPAPWRVGDKTGTGAYGTAHDVAVLWRPQQAPLVLAIYTHHDDAQAPANNAAIARAARAVAHWQG